MDCLVPACDSILRSSSSSLLSEQECMVFAHLWGANKLLYKLLGTRNARVNFSAKVTGLASCTP
eukprot:1679120-Prorocentrum_lima.AAC.1